MIMKLSDLHDFVWSGQDRIYNFLELYCRSTIFRKIGSFDRPVVRIFFKGV